MTYLASSSGLDLERPVLQVRLHLGGVELATDKTLGVEHGVGSVHGNLVLGGIADQTLSVVECDIGRGGTVTLVVGNDLHTIVLPHSDTGVGSTEINTDLE